MAWGLALAAGQVLLTFGGVSLIVWQSLHPARFALRRTPEDDGVPFENVTFPSRDAFPLAGWWVPVTSPKATVILCHGYPSDRRDVLPMVPFLHAAGYNVLAFDFRRLGESGGQESTVGLREPRDLLGAVDYAAMRSKAPIAALGQSMGAATCIMAAATEPRIRAVIADSPYASLDVQTARRFGGGPFGRMCGAYAVWLGQQILNERLRDASPLDAVKHLASQPLLLIHSLNDSLIPCGDSRRIFSAAHGVKELWITSASGHVRSYGECTAEYQQRVLGFLRSAMPRSTVR